MPLDLFAALSLFSQFLMGPPLPPLAPEVVKAQEEALRYRIEKLPDDTPNGWEIIVEAAGQLPKFEKPVFDACAAAVKGKPHDVTALGQLAGHSDFSRRTIQKALAMSGWQARPWEPEALPAEYHGGKAMAQMVRPLIAGILLAQNSPEKTQIPGDVMVLAQFADRASRKATVLVDGLAASSIGAYVDSVILRLLAEDRLDALELGELAAVLRKYPRSPSDLREVFRHEFATFSRIFYSDSSWREFVRSNAGPGNVVFNLLHPYYFNAPMSRRLLESEAAEIVAHLGEPFGKNGPPGFLKVEAWTKDRIQKEWAKRNIGGEMLALGQLRAYGKIMPGIVLNQTSRGMISVAVALKRWQSERGSKLPERLEQLVPHYLPSVPVDYIVGKPLRYDRGQRIVYSVGSDLIDDLPPIPETPSLVIGDGNAVLRFP